MKFIRIEEAFERRNADPQALCRIIGAVRTAGGAEKGSAEHMREHTMMKKQITAIVAAFLMAMSMSGVAAASQDNLGVVGEPNCHGQRMSYHASSDEPGRNGTPAERARNNPDYDNAGEINQAVRGFCDSPGQ